MSDNNRPPLPAYGFDQTSYPSAPPSYSEQMQFQTMPGSQQFQGQQQPGIGMPAANPTPVYNYSFVGQQPSYQHTTIPEPNSVPGNNNWNPGHVPPGAFMPQPPFQAYPQYPTNPYSTTPAQQNAVIPAPDANWSHKLFGCCNYNPSVAMVTAVCPAKTHHDLSKMTSNHMTSTFVIGLYIATFVFALGTIIVLLLVDVNDEDGVSVPYHFARILIPTLFVFCFVYWFLLVVKYRTQIRRFFRIKGGADSDCLLSLFCAQCVLCQLKAELEEQKKKLNPPGGVFNIPIRMSRRTTRRF
ncbi:uncharacterized protein LOC142354065 [Convolutriloba macropyga]|uniref:uncharacterized protein LOC142354065 n=1 Tax=Convolutriloba macropyga TaxID=536237 RepID=UPI003F524473